MVETVTEALTQWLKTAEMCPCKSGDKEKYMCRDVECLKDKTKAKTYCDACQMKNWENHPHKPIMMFNLMIEADKAWSLGKEEILNILASFAIADKKYSEFEPLLKYFHT